MRITRFLGVFTLSVFASLNALAQQGNYNLVTDDMLHNAPQGEWLNWRGGDNSWGYSPLEQIDTDNVGQMQLVWSWALDNTGAQDQTSCI